MAYGYCFDCFCRGMFHSGNQFRGGGEGGWNQLEYNPKMDLSLGPYSALEYTRVHWMHRSVREYTGVR